MEEILTAEQVAQILQIHQFTVLKFIKQGKLKASKLGRVYRIRRSDVEKFLDNQSQKAAQKEEEKKEKKKEVLQEQQPQKEESAEGTPGTEGATGAKEEPSSEKKTEIPGPPLEVPTKEVPVKREPPARSDSNDLDHYVLELKAQ